MFFRSIVAAALLAAQALAGPALTTIQDVLYKADGTRFSGTLTISWSSFQSADNSAIITQSATVKVIDGNLRVQLVPSTSGTPAIYYSVTYNSDGRVQFKETWSVPSSAQPVRLRDVRVAASQSSSGTSVVANETVPVQESDVVGLIADLGARPLKGAGYAAGRVAMVNAVGALESVVGGAADCVRVDGSSGPCGAEATTFVDGDAPSGIVDGSNTVFTLANLPVPASSLAIYRNGLLQKAGDDYAVSGRTVTFAAGAAPQPGDTLLGSYRLQGTGAATGTTYANAQVLCGGAGATITNTEFTSAGTCSIPAGALAAGDRVEIRFDLAHQGTASGFSFDVLWGATTAAARDAAAGETLVSGRVDAAVLSTGAQLSYQTWGAVLAFGTGVAAASDNTAGGLTINFRGRLAATGDTLTLKNFSVVRLP